MPIPRQRTGTLLDLVLLADRARRPQQLLVLWKDGAGGFSLENATLLASPDDELIRDFKLPDDEQWRLVFVTSSGLFATSRRASREFASPLLRSALEGGIRWRSPT